MARNPIPSPTPALAFLLVLAVVGCSSPEAYVEPASPTGSPRAVAADEADPADRPCTAETDCGDGQYCARPVGVCDSEAGSCAEMPQICTQDWTPVCGCDGKTYGNRCGAAAAGQNVAYEGECREPATT